MQQYNDPDFAIRKSKGTDWYLLPPAIFPSDPLDTMYVRYLNYSNAPIVSPLEKSLKIELYNDMYFDSTVKIHSVAKDKLSYPLDYKALVPCVTDSSLNIKDIFSEFKTNMDHSPPIETKLEKNTGCLHSDIV